MSKCILAMLMLFDKADKRISNKICTDPSLLILTYMCGDVLDDEQFVSYYMRFINTLPISGADKTIVITPDVDIADRHRYIKHVDVFLTNSGSKYVFLDRHYWYYRLIIKYMHEYDYVLCCDSKDIIFQLPVLDWAKNSGITDKVVLVSEGLKIAQCESNMIDVSNFLKVTSVAESSDGSYYTNSPLVNGGVIFGPSDITWMINFMIWSIMAVSPIGKFHDQTALGWIYYHINDVVEKIYLSDPNEDSFCLIGSGMVRGAINAKYDNGIYKNKKGEIYHIVHQWNYVEYGPNK